MEITLRTQIMMISLLAATILIFFGYLSKDVGVFGNMVLFASLDIFLTAIFLKYQSYREIREMEEKFPSFVRDLQENLRAGMSLPQAIYQAKKMNYGRLSKEVEKMANKISWGIPVQKVLDNFSKSIPSARIASSMQIIKEAHTLGGDIVSTLDSVINNLRMLEEAEKEKKSIINQYVLIIYAVTLIFIGIVISINKLLVPIFLSSLTNVPELGIQNPCSTCYGFTCSICDMFDLTASSVFSIKTGTPSAYYISLFFFMSVIQAFFAGLVIGQITENSYVAGLKHSTILLGIVIAMFTILVRVGVLA